MMRKLLILLLLCCLAASPAHAGILTDSICRVDTAYPFSVGNALPLPDGGIVLAGQVSYPNSYRTADMKEVDRLTKNVTDDGYAICLNEDGTTRWDFYGGMPGRWNNCKALGLLPDGRVVLSVRHVESTNLRTQLYSYYYVDQEGNVEKDEQLYGRFANAFDPETVEVVSAGFYGGADTELKNWNGVYPTDATLLDFDGREIWRHNPSDLGAHYRLSIRETADGYMLYGDDYYDALNAKESSTLVRKLDREGKEIWTFNGKSTGPSGGAYQLTTMPDGGVLFRSVYSPDGMLLDEYKNPSYALTRLDKDGKHLWSRFYDGEGYVGIGGAEPLGDRIVLGATLLFPNHELLLLDGNGDIVGKVAYGETEDAQLGNIPALVRGPDGSLYAYGTLHEKTPPTSLTGGATICSFYVKIDESLFH